MTETKFTPGEWRVDKQADTDELVIREKGCFITANCEVDSDGIATEERIANARLIARSPNMYRLLERLYALIDYGEQQEDDAAYLNDVASLKADIWRELAKARGEA